MPHRQRFHTRREMLARCATGFGAVACATLFGKDLAGFPQPAPRGNPMAPRPTHFPARARSVIFLYMDGGPSQVDTFDPKPRLAQEHGQPMPMRVEPTQFNNIGRVMQSPWRFRQFGRSGIPVSDLFPNVATCVDDLASIRSMTSDFSD